MIPLDSIRLHCTEHDDNVDVSVALDDGYFLIEIPRKICIWSVFPLADEQEILKLINSENPGSNVLNC